MESEKSFKVQVPAEATPRLDSFNANLDEEVGRASAASAGISIVGGIVWLPSLIWLIKTAKAGHDASLPLFVLVATSVVTLVGLTIIGRGLKPLSKTQRQARRVLLRLYSARAENSVKVGVHVGTSAAAQLGWKISDQVAPLLNEAAKYTLEARSALEQPAWRDVTGPRARAREDALIAINEAMARVVVLATSTGDSSEVQRLIADLSEVATEVTDANRRLEAVSGKTGDGSVGLRAALEQLREISRAEDEILEHRRH